MTGLASITNLWEVLGWTMLHFLWMGSVAFALSAGVRWCFRRSSPELRYVAAFLCLLSVSSAAGAALIVSLQQVGSAVAESGAAVSPQEFTSAEAPPLHMDLIGRGSLFPPNAAPLPPAVRDLTPAEALRREVFHSTLNVVAQVLPWLWVCGTPLVVLALVTGIIGTTRLRRRSRAVTDEQLLGQVQRLRVLLGISRRVGLAVCEQVSSPMVIGVLRPLIVLPPAMISGLAPAQFEMILLHELAHVRRWDNLVNLLQRTIEALLFYHPAVWWASRWVRLEREHCCDALVLSHNHTPQSYAETLATLALPELAPQFATAAMANHQLTSRICHILNVEEKTMTVSMRSLFGGIVLLAAAFGGFLLATLRSDRAAADDPVEDAASESQEVENAASGRLMFGVGVNSDAGVSGHIVYEEDDETFENLTIGPADGLAAGESLATWGRRAWSANEATGPPDVPEAGDNEHAWASLTEDGQEEWLRLTFEKPVRAAAVIVYESFNPGALYKVTSRNSDGAEFPVWQGEDPVAVQDGKGVSIVMPPQMIKLSEVTLHLNSPEVEGWNEIDAVGLIDRVTGEVHWAVSAEASSSYAGHADYYHHAGERNLAQQCGHCHTGVHGSTGAAPGSTRQRIEQLRSELQRLQYELLVEELLHSPNHPGTWERQYLLDAFNNAGSAETECDQSQREALDHWINAEWQQVVDPNVAAPDNLQQLRQTLEMQQQAIERLTDVLEQLQQRLNSGDEGGGSADPDTGAESGAATAPALGPAPLAMNFAFPPESGNVIDAFILEQMRDSGLERSKKVTDEEFIRRVYLDLFGLVPTAEETQRFLEDESETRREDLIERLLLSQDGRAQLNRNWRFYFGTQE